MDQKERLEKEIEQLKRKLELCFEKRLLTDDPEKEITLEDLEKSLDIKLQEKERQLSQLSAGVINRNRSALSLGEGLCSIDFDKAKEIFRSVTKRLTDEEGGAALLLMEQCLDLEGRLLLNSMRNFAFAEKTRRSLFHEYPLAFSPIMPANRLAFLKLLAGHLNSSSDSCEDQESDQRLAEITQEIMNALSERLRSGTTILISLTNWKSLSWEDQPVFLSWLISDFWQALTHTLNQAMEEHSPRIVLVLMVDRTIAEPCNTLDCFCQETKLASQKLLRLPLGPWSQTDVKRWLGSYSSKLNKSQRNLLVKNIFNGQETDIPLKIRTAIEDAHAQSIF